MIPYCCNCCLSANIGQVSGDSGVDTEYDSDMVSVTSSTYDHRFLRTRRFIPPIPRLSIDETRRFHGIANNPYPLPNDEVEKDRLDELQIMFHALLGENVVAPISRTPHQIGSFGSTPHNCWSKSTLEPGPEGGLSKWRVNFPRLGS